MDHDFYKGIIVKESLINSNFLDKIQIKNVSVSENGWHLYSVKISEKEIEIISHNLKSNKWYAHFWNGQDVIAIFKDKMFKFNFDKKETWKPAIQYGLSLGIPEEQLDFPIDN